MPRVLRVGLTLAVRLTVLSVVLGGEIHAQSTTNPYRATFDWAQLPMAEKWER